MSVPIERVTCLSELRGTLNGALILLWRAISRAMVLERKRAHHQPRTALPRRFAFRHWCRRRSRGHRVLDVTQRGFEFWDQDTKTAAPKGGEGAAVLRVMFQGRLDIKNSQLR